MEPLKKATAIRLRHLGKSYTEIVRELQIPKSTLATWLRDVVLPPPVIAQLYSRARSAGTAALVARNKRQTVVAQERALVIHQAEAHSVGPLSKRELWLIGATLYWAEGTKRSRPHSGKRVAFSNADPTAIALMMRFFREVCQVPAHKFRGQVIVAPGIDGDAAIAYWSVVTGIDSTQFTRICNGLSQASRQKRPRQRLPYGTLQLRISDTRLFHRILGWIQGIQRGAACEPEALAP